MTEPTKTERPRHTPGPWRIGFLDGSGVIGEESGAYVYQPTEDFVVVRGGSDEGIPVGVRRQADAHLIAASPALYEALKALANEATGFLAMADPTAHGQTNLRCLDRRIDEARKALALAEGRET